MEEKSNKTGSMTFKKAMSLAISADQMMALSQTQVKLFRHMIAMLWEEQGDKITPAMIQGEYELVTEYLTIEGLEGV